MFLRPNPLCYSFTQCVEKGLSMWTMFVNLAIEQRTPKPARTLSKAIHDNMSYMAMYMAIFAFNILIICAY